MVKVLVKFIAIYYGVYVGLCLCWTDLICFEREIPAHGWIPNYMFSETKTLHCALQCVL